MYFTKDNKLNKQKQKYCRCILKVAKNNSNQCNKNKNWDNLNNKCYNPYTVCAASTKTTTGGLTCGYNFLDKNISNEQIESYINLNYKAIQKWFKKKKLSLNKYLNNKLYNNQLRKLLDKWYKQKKLIKQNGGNNDLLLLKNNVQKLLNFIKKHSYIIHYKTSLMNDKEIEYFYNPPKSAMLKMTEVLKIANKKINFMYVVEPQQYKKVTKLNYKHFMFEDRKNDNKYSIGYFHTGKSGIAQSGDGDDYGDKWWKVNKSLLNHLKKTEKIINNIKLLMLLDENLNNLSNEKYIEAVFILDKESFTDILLYIRREELNINKKDIFDKIYFYNEDPKKFIPNMITKNRFTKYFKAEFVDNKLNDIINKLVELDHKSYNVLNPLYRNKEYNKIVKNIKIMEKKLDKIDDIRIQNEDKIKEKIKALKLNEKQEEDMFEKEFNKLDKVKYKLLDNLTYKNYNKKIRNQYKLKRKYNQKYISKKKTSTRIKQDLEKFTNIRLKLNKAILQFSKNVLTENQIKLFIKGLNEETLEIKGTDFYTDFNIFALNAREVAKKELEMGVKWGAEMNLQGKIPYTNKKATRRQEINWWKKWLKKN